MERAWQDVSDEEYYRIETDVVNAGLNFIADFQAKKEPAVAEALKSLQVLRSGDRLLRRVVEVRFGANLLASQKPAERVKDDFRKTNEILKKIQRLMDGVPPSIKSRFNWKNLDQDVDPDTLRFTLHDHNLATEGHFFSLEVDQLLSQAIEECEINLRPQRGPRPNLQLALPVKCCVAALEALTGRKFIRNFDSAKHRKGPDFVNFDAKFCQIVLQTLDPALEHKQLKSALKMHFANSSLNAGQFPPVSTD